MTPPNQPEKRKRGRPKGSVKYGPDVFELILGRLAEGWSLRRACNEKGMPDAAVVVRRALADADFSQRYTRARQVGFLLMAEELAEIADDGRNDTYVDDNGDVIINHDVVARSRLRLDTRKWLLAKMLPKVYGEREQGGGDALNVTEVRIYLPQQHGDSDFAARLLRARAALISGGNGRRSVREIDTISEEDK